jgi:protein ImuB
VHLSPPLATLVDDAGEAVRVDGRGALSEPPATLALAAGRAIQVTDWGGPWPADEWWWDHTRHRRRARLQVTTVDGRAYLLACADGHWLVEAEYD